MKTNKSPDDTEVTPSKKKLKQARLPFKTISESSPTSVPVQTRKRKLSESESETTPKLGKICKENDHVEELVVISDDDSKDGQKPQKQDKSINPFVKLVDTAWKKKLQKTKTSKRKKSARSKSLTNGSVENESGNDTAEEKAVDDSEMMDVDETNQESGDQNNDTEKQTDTNKNIPNKSNSYDAVVLIDDSSMPSDNLNKDDNKKEYQDKSESKQNFNNINTLKTKEKDNIEDSKNNEEENNKETNPVTSDTPNETTSESDTDKSLCEDKYDRESPKSDSKSKTEAEDKTEKSPKENIIVTPKRSLRNKANKSLNSSMSSTNSKLNESVTSNPTTPKQSRSSSVTSAQGNESLNDSATVGKNLTPKQLQKKIESTKKREEREKEKQEREKKKQQEKDEKAKQKQEKEEQKRKEREEKEEQKRKEKEEKEKQKEMEKKLREEKEEQKKKEKEEKEEQRRKEKEARDEEKRKKQEAVELEKQEAELKKKKAAEAFVNFFVPKQKSEKDQTTVGPISKNSVLSSFTIKTDMRLAPTKRVDLDEEQRKMLDSFLHEQNGITTTLYLKCLKDGTSKPLSSGKTWPLTDKDDDDDVMIVEDELPPMDAAGEILTCDSVPREKLRPKLLSFHENRRPPYWGTWRKKSTSIKPRKPFGQDQKQLDYEVDSDEEWEEEQEGESIDGSAAGSDDEQEADEYEVDNEVFVPHGYLSDEEATMDDDDVLSLSPETQKARLKHLEDEFESEMKKPTEKLKPRMYGLLWETTDGGKPDKCVDSLWNYFGKLSMIMNDLSPLLQPSNEPEETEKKKVKKKKVVNAEVGDQKSPKPDKKKKIKPEDKEAKASKPEVKKNVSEKKNQPGINVFLKKMKTS